MFRSNFQRTMVYSTLEIPQFNSLKCTESMDELGRTHLNLSENDRLIW